MGFELGDSKLMIAKIHFFGYSTSRCTHANTVTLAMWLLSTWNMTGLKWNVLPVKYTLDLKHYVSKNNVNYLISFS